MSHRPETAHSPGDAAAGSALRIWACGFGAALALFSLTLAPDVLMMDSGEYQCAVHRFPRLDLGDRPGDLVRLHPVYLAAAKLVSLVPVGPLAGRVNFASALFGAVAVANTAVLAWLATRDRRAALLAAPVLMFGHTLWAFAVIAEVMSLLAALLTLELICWWKFAEQRRRGWLLALALLNGLGVATHLQLGLSTVVYAATLLLLWRRGALSFAFLVAWAALWMIGTLPYSAIVGHYLVRTGDAAFVLRSATLGLYGARLDQARGVTILRGAAALLLNYPTLLGALAIPGALTLRRRATESPAAGVMIAVALVQLLFALTYAVPDQYSFFVPFYAVAAALIGIGAQPLLARRPGRVALPLLALAPIAIYAAAAPLMRHAGVRFVGRSAPYRDPYDFFIKPWKTGWDGQRRYLREAFEQLPPDAVVLASPTMISMMQYAQQVEGVRPDVTLTTRAADLLAWLDDGSGVAPRWTRPVFAADAEATDFPVAVSQTCVLTPAGLMRKIGPPRNGPEFRRFIVTTDAQ